MRWKRWYAKSRRYRVIIVRKDLGVLRNIVYMELSAFNLRPASSFVAKNERRNAYSHNHGGMGVRFEASACSSTRRTIELEGWTYFPGRVSSSSEDDDDDMIQVFIA